MGPKTPLIDPSPLLTSSKRNTLVLLQLTRVVMPKLPSIANSIANSYQIKKNEGSGENGRVYCVPAGKQ